MDVNDEADLARLRTDFAEDRTVIANERTFGSWLRTGFAAIGIALGFHALFGRIHPLWLPRAVATAFLLIAILIFVAAERRACTVHERLHAHRGQPIRLTRIRLITIIAVLSTVALGTAIWLFSI